MAKLKIIFFLTALIHPLMICKALIRDPASHANWRLLNPENCGTSNADRIIGGKNAQIGQYPWMARIGYVPRTKPSQAVQYDCAGAVINKFYIITAAHCSVKLHDDLKIVKVLLGEHNIKTNPDCEGSYCNDPYKEYNVVEVTAHENYSPTTLKNDVALLRVSEEIKFTNFIKPICVTRGKMLKRLLTEKMTELAGWGYIDSSSTKKSDVLQTLRQRVNPLYSCTREPAFKRFNIDSSQLCVGTGKGKDSCGGDSGGPLMKVEAGIEKGPPRYFIVGIVSFGLKLCGVMRAASVYTNLSKFVLWILDHVRP